MQGIGTKQRVIYWLIVVLLGTTLWACAAPATLPPANEQASEPTAQTPAFVSEAADVALPQLVNAERTAAHERNLALLATLWAEAGQVVDGKATADTSDDYHWQGRAAVLDRYLVAVFPNPPPLRERDPSLELRVDGTHAYAVDTENHDQWEFTFEQGRWWLLVLRYSFSTP
ncbi:MAG: hypothetical protein U0175_29940 [Caldilineaceae bacterium]